MVKLILDESKAHDFVEFLQDGKYYCIIEARKKYGATKDTRIADFFVDKKYLVKEIQKRQMNESFLTVPQESIVVFVSVNPVCPEVAFRNLHREMADLACKGDFKDPTNLARKHLVNSGGNGDYIDFDFDNGHFDPQLIYEKAGSQGVDVVKTRGGYHVVVENKLAAKEEPMFYKNLESLGTDSISKKRLIPMVGCRQGDFMPIFL